MIRPAQRKLLDRAREAVASDPAAFAELLRRYGGADRVEDLTAAGLARLLDHFTVTTRSNTRQRPVLSARTRKLIENAARREVTPAQLRLLQLARKQTGISDKHYYGMLQDYGAVLSASDLDRRGFELCMAFLEAEGFERRPVAPAAPAAPAFGRRPGFATPEQVDLIRTLWRAWSGPSADSEAAVEAGLNAWLERYHATSSLRFLTTARAGKVITALRAMKARAKPKGEATHA